MENICKKLRKIVLFSLFLVPSANVMASKTYFYAGEEEKVSRVLDVGMLFDAAGRDGSQEERMARKNVIGAITFDLLSFIRDEEAAIVSAPLVRNLIKIAQESTRKKKARRLTIDMKGRKKTKKEEEELKKLDCYLKEKPLCEKALKDIFGKNWSIFMTKDYEFVVLIPRKKYQDVDCRQDLLKIGLNPDVLETIHYYSHKPEKSYDANELLGYLEKQKSMNSISLGSFLSIFSDKEQAKMVDKRGWVSGHGSDKVIANLTSGKYGEFRELRDDFNKKGFSFVFYSTCFGGGTVHNEMTLMMDKNRKRRKGRELSSKDFIEVVQGVPGYSVSLSSKASFNDFFFRVNRFLKEEMKNYESYFLVTQRDGESDARFRARKSLFAGVYKKLSEQEMLCGKYCIAGKNYKKPSLVKRNKKIKEDLYFKRIFEALLEKASAVNVPRCRFPGDEKMTTISEVTRDVVQIITYDDVKDLEPGDTFKIKPGATDVFIETTIINATLEIDADYKLPELHPAIFGDSHHFIKKIVLKYTGIEPSKGEFLDKCVMPKEDGYDGAYKAFFIGELSDQGLGRTCSFENVFYFKDEKNKKWLYRKVLREKKYKALKDVSCVAKCKKTEYTSDSDIDNAEWHILKLMGLSKPDSDKYKRGESFGKSLKTMVGGMNFITKFTKKDREIAAEDCRDEGEKKQYKFRADFLRLYPVS